MNGHTNLDNVSIAGVTTFTGAAEFDGNAKFDSTITAGGATGTNGQYLKTTGSGVEWATFPSLRTRSYIHCFFWSNNIYIQLYCWVSLMYL